MALRGYFDSPGGRLPLAALRICGGLQGGGIEVKGGVLEGRMSVDEAMVLSWIRGKELKRGEDERAFRVERGGFYRVL